MLLSLALALPTVNVLSVLSATLEFALPSTQLELLAPLLWANLAVELVTPVDPDLFASSTFPLPLVATAILDH